MVISESTLRFGKELGSGAFGTVYEVHSELLEGGGTNVVAIVGFE